jgi:dolichyl-phosphate-mannose-protein mannosyltransferase
VAYLLLRSILATLPGYVPDLALYKSWMIITAHNGISQVYLTTDYDYPPIFIYYLYPLGKIYLALFPEPLDSIKDSTFLTVLIKLPPLIMDLALGWLLYLVVRISIGTRPRWIPALGGVESSGEHWLWLLPLLYLCNPAVLFNGGYWGAPDPIHCFYVFAAILMLGGRLAWPSWVLLTIASSMKPLAMPFFPLLCVVSILRFGMRGTLKGIGSAVITVLVVLLPFLVTGQGTETFQRMLIDINIMPYTSVNAHNFWWVVGGWMTPDTPWLGPLTPTQAGLGAFGLLNLGLFYRGHQLHSSQIRGISPRQLFALAFGIGFGFFMFSTHMHENHLFITIPLMMPLLFGSGRSVGQSRWVFAAVTIGVFFNLILHDPTIPAHWPFTLGGDSTITSPNLQRPFRVVEIMAIYFSTFWNITVFIYILNLIFRSGKEGWLEGFGWRSSASI